MPGIPVGDTEKLHAQAENFRTSRDPPSPLWGCIGAVDVIALAIKKPQYQYFPRNFYTRKGFFAMPIQDVCDSNYKFLNMSALCVGSVEYGSVTLLSLVLSIRVMLEILVETTA
jgi:hypothetical protein